MDIVKRQSRKAARKARQSIAFQFKIEKARAPCSFADFVFQEENLIESFVDVKVDDQQENSINFTVVTDVGKSLTENTNLDVPSTIEEESPSNETVILAKEPVTDKIETDNKNDKDGVKKAGKVDTKVKKPSDKIMINKNLVKYKPGMAPRKAVGPVLKPSSKPNVFKFKGTKGTKPPSTPDVKLTKKTGTPGVKFDLQASLKRKPTWKMHTGGLKKANECYTPDAKKNLKKVSKIQEIREANKENMKNGIKNGRNNKIMKSRKFV